VGCRGDSGEAVTTERREWASHRCVPRGNDLVRLLGFSSVNLGSYASYRHDGRGPLSTDPVVTSLFKVLTGEAPGTRSLTEPPVLRSTQHKILGKK
jgi:hypothetical protein